MTNKELIESIQKHHALLEITREIEQCKQECKDGDALVRAAQADQKVRCDRLLELLERRARLTDPTRPSFEDRKRDMDRYCDPCLFVDEQGA